MFYYITSVTQQDRHPCPLVLAHVSSNPDDSPVVDFSLKNTTIPRSVEHFILSALDPQLITTLTQGLLIFLTTRSAPNLITTLASISLGVWPHFQTHTTGRHADRSHIAPSQLSSYQTSTTKLRRPTATHSTFSYRYLAEHLTELSTSFR